MLSTYKTASTNSYDISAYKTEMDGISKLQEKNSKMLGDDYVKFFRFSERIINENKEGVLAFVSNNGFLEQITLTPTRLALRVATERAAPRLEFKLRIRLVNRQMT